MMTVTVWLDLWRETVVVRRRFGEEPASAGDRFAGQTATERYLSHYRWLRDAVDHPVIEVVHRDDRRLILSTRFAGAATVSCASLPPDDASRLISAVARAVARLHACGLAHGDLTGDHIVLHGHRFRLCSPSAGTAGLAEPSEDVAAFGPLIDGFVSGWADSTGRPQLNASARQRWRDLASMAADPSMSAARLAAQAERLG